METPENHTDKPPTSPPALPQAIDREISPGNERHALSALLKAPAWFVQRIDADEDLFRRGTQLFLWGLAFHAAFGFAMALFGGLDAGTMTLVKAPLIALCSLILCMPSLYVFACVGGMPITFSQAYALAGSALAMTGLLLLGFTPVTWLFAVSTNSLGFVVILNFLIWLTSVSFAIRFFSQFKGTKRLNKTAGLQWWLVVYIVVSLQMATTMRPLLSKPTTGWWEPGKKFFLAHFVECFDSRAPGAPATPR